MTESGPIPVCEGELVAGKYRVGPVIGVGGMGVVVAALHEQLDKRVAIKFVRGEVLGNDEAVRRFLHEARAAAKLKSEHAAEVLDVGLLESGVPYMVMELLEGGDLAQTLLERGPLPIEVAADWIAQACEAVAEAHAAGIVHRDLKPQNLFLARTVGGALKVKVLDFGVSKSIETIATGPGALTRTRSMLGSPLYMAPEQMRSARNVDCRADVWALGVVLFELLTQRLPFEAETLPDLCLKVVSERPQSLLALRPDAPAAMERLIGCCLEKDADRRFANAAELASALEPMVPAASRAVVERARLAMTRVPQATPPGVFGVAVRSDGVAARSAGRRKEDSGSPAPRTPAAWGSERGGRRKSKATLAGLALLATLAIGGAALAILRRPVGVPRQAQASLSAAAEQVPSVVRPPETTSPAVVASVALAPPEDPPPPTAGASDPATSAKAARSAPMQVRPVFVETAHGAAPHPTVPRPPAGQSSDDIPALR